VRKPARKSFFITVYSLHTHNWVKVVDVGLNGSTSERCVFLQCVYIIVATCKFIWLMPSLNLTLKC